GTPVSAGPPGGWRRRRATGSGSCAWRCGFQGPAARAGRGRRPARAALAPRSTPGWRAGTRSRAMHGRRAGLAKPCPGSTAPATMAAKVRMGAVVATGGRGVLGALVLGLYAPKVLRGRRSAALEIGTRAGLIQAWIEHGSRIRAGQGQERPSRHTYDDRSDFHDDP